MRHPPHTSGSHTAVPPLQRIVFINLWVDLMRMEFEEAQQLYSEGYDCAQSIVHVFMDRFEDIDEADVMRCTSLMSMGLFEGSICGALLGAFVVIGLKYGGSTPKMSDKGMAIIKREQFMMEFRKLYKGTTCPELTGFDVRIDEENLKAYESGIYTEFCPRLCMNVVNILEKIL